MKTMLIKFYFFKPNFTSSASRMYSHRAARQYIDKRVLTTTTTVSQSESSKLTFKCPFKASENQPTGYLVKEKFSYIQGDQTKGSYETGQTTDSTFQTQTNDEQLLRSPVLGEGELVRSPVLGEGELVHSPMSGEGELVHSPMSGDGDIVLVTGGSGFLGQHIVSLLHTKAPNVAEIRVLDLKPFVNTLDENAVKPVRSYKGCITDHSLLQEALQGVTSVFHIAGMISYGTFPDFKGMHKINIEGTSNVINACLSANVPRLIYCSTVDVAIGYDDIIDGDEVTTAAPPSNFLFPGYPESKYRAECLVLQANGQKTSNGNSLRTLSLRANVMYGEGDPYYITNGLRSAHRASGTLYQVGDGMAKFQSVYVGNSAWAFLCADAALVRHAELGGQYYYIPDDTPVQNTFTFMKPFLETRGYQLSHRKLPYRLMYILLSAAELFVKILSPIYKINLPSQSYTVRYINMNLFFSRSKAQEELRFTPLFLPSVAMERSLRYYRNMKL